MNQNFRVYGHLAGMDAAQIQACLDGLTSYECVTPEPGVLDFVHEGFCVDVESDLQRLLPVLGIHVRGIVDVIDHQDWEMYRYTIVAGELHRDRIALDNALDTAYASEHRS